MPAYEGYLLQQFQQVMAYPMQRLYCLSAGLKYDRVVSVPPEWYAQFGASGHDLEHLTFGTEDHGVTEPQYM